MVSSKRLPEAAKFVKDFSAEIGSTLKNLGAINANGSGPGVEFTLAPALVSVIRASFRSVAGCLFR